MGIVNMDENILPDLLEELLERLGVRIRCEAIKQDQDLSYVAGGLCVLWGEYVLICSNSELQWLSKREDYNHGYSPEAL